MKMTNYLITIVPEQTQDFVPDTKTFVLIGSIVTITYMTYLLLRRPTIIFKYRISGDNEERAINYNVWGDLPALYIVIPYLIYTKNYTAKFVCLDGPTQKIVQYNLPDDLIDMQNDLSILRQEFININDFTDEMYIKNEEMMEEIRELNELHGAWIIDPNRGEHDWDNELRYGYLVEKSHLADKALYRNNTTKMKMLSEIRKHEALIKIYEPNFDTLPTYDWEFE